MLKSYGSAMGKAELGWSLGQYISQVCTRSWEDSAGGQDYLYSWLLPRTGIRRQWHGAELLK